eukprot:1034666-Pelagomonas_calceolata.AAC.1
MGVSVSNGTFVVEGMGSIDCHTHTHTQEENCVESDLGTLINAPAWFRVLRGKYLLLCGLLLVKTLPPGLARWLVKCACWERSFPAFGGSRLQHSGCTLTWRDLG